jgi:hypothetical protein
MKAENQIQANAIHILCPEGEVWRELKVIDLFGKIWRDIINEYKADHGRLPGEQDLIFLTGVKIKHDPRKDIT